MDPDPGTADPQYDMKDLLDPDWFHMANLANFLPKKEYNFNKKIEKNVFKFYIYFFSKLILWKVTKSNPKYNIFHANFALNIFFFHADFLHLDPDPHNNVCGSTSLANFLLFFLSPKRGCFLKKTDFSPIFCHRKKS